MTIAMIIGLVWAFHTCYRKHQEGLNDFLSIFGLFVLNYLFWWICIPYKLITGKDLLYFK